jgi:KUP system potassium uptake protein
MGCVLGVVILFKSSTALASAYGIAVTATMILTTLMAVAVVWRLWHWPLWRVALVVAPLLILEAAFFVANSAKLFEGGWLPLLIAAILFIVMVTWRRGAAILHEQSSDVELSWLVKMLEAKFPHRIPGTAVFMASDTKWAPSSLLHNVKHNSVIHERNVVICLQTAPVPRVPRGQQLSVSKISPHFTSVNVCHGFMERPSVPQILQLCRRHDLNVDPSQTSFFLSRRKLKPTSKSKMPQWQDRLFIRLSQSAEDAAANFQIPGDRVVELGRQVAI